MSSDPYTQCNSRYPTTDAMKNDAYYGTSWGSDLTGEEHYLMGRPHYQAHFRAMQQGSRDNIHEYAKEYQAQFSCGGFAKANAKFAKKAAKKPKCPPSPADPSCQCRAWL